MADTIITSTIRKFGHQYNVVLEREFTDTGAEVTFRIIPLHGAPSLRSDQLDLEQVEKALAEMVALMVPESSRFMDSTYDEKDTSPDNQ